MSPRDPYRPLFRLILPAKGSSRQLRPLPDEDESAAIGLRHLATTLGLALVMGGLIIARDQHSPSTLVVSKPTSIDTLTLANEPFSLLPVSQSEPAPLAQTDPAEPLAEPANVRLSGIEVLQSVGRALVVKAMVLDEQNRPLLNHPLEWTVAGRSVGQLIQTGEFSSTSTDRSNESLTSRRARTSTARESHSIKLDRETDAEIALRPGEAWCVVHSDRAGDMWIEATALGRGSLDRRRSAARLHWKRAAGRFPTPSVNAPLGGRRSLTTFVVDEKTQTPLAGYLVSYRIVDSKENTAPTPPRSLDVVSDSAGAATVSFDSPKEAVRQRCEITLWGPTALGETPIAIAQSTVELAWIDARSMARIKHSIVAEVDQPTTLALSLDHAGIEKKFGSIHPASWTASLPADVVDSNGRAPVVTIEIPKELNASATLAVVGRREGIRTIDVQLNGPSGTWLRAFATIEFVRPALAVRKDVEALIMVDRSYSVEIEVTNTGKIPARDIVVSEDLPNGFELKEGDGIVEGGRLMFQHKVLAPGERQTFRYRGVCARANPSRTYRTEARGAGVTAACSTSLRVLGAPALDVELVDERDPVAVGDVARYAVRIRNRGNERAQGVVLESRLAGNGVVISSEGRCAGLFSPTSTQGTTFDVEPGETLEGKWSIRSLGVGELRLTLRLKHASLDAAGIEAQESTIIYRPVLAGRR